MVDIHSATAEIRRGKKEERKNLEETIEQKYRAAKKQFLKQPTILSFALDVSSACDICAVKATLLKMEM